MASRYKAYATAQKLAAAWSAATICSDTRNKPGGCQKAGKAKKDEEKKVLGSRIGFCPFKPQPQFQKIYFDP